MKRASKDHGDAVGTLAKPMVREANKRRLQAEILEVATDLISRHGYEAVTLSQIAAAAGISRRTFFHYFKAKEDLMFSRVDGYGQFVLDTILEQAPNMDACDNLEHAMLSFAKRFESDRTHISQVTRTYYESAELRGRLYGEILVWEACWAEALQKAYKAPVSKKYIYQTMVASAFSTFNNTARTWAQSKEHTRLDKALAKSLAVLKQGWKAFV